MGAKVLDDDIKEEILIAQRNEITEYIVYEKLSQSIKNPSNRQILQHIANDELEHYNFWKNYTHENVHPHKLKIWKYVLISKIFGVRFGIKLMERGEEQAQVTYQKISKFVPAAKSIIKDEDKHEKELVDLLDEERLKYIGSMVLGLNDALVELTGALAGLTFAFQNTRLIAMAGLITGIAASLSMAASEYLSTEVEETVKKPAKASLYTGSTYVFTVLLLISPYLLLSDPYISLGLTIVIAVFVIFVFTFYVSVVKDIRFSERFSKMLVVSLGIAALTFILGYLIRASFNIDV